MRDSRVQGWHGGRGARYAAPRPKPAPLIAISALALALVLVGLIGAAGALALEPDGRGIELVSPEKPGPTVTNLTNISPDGEAAVFISFGSFSDAAAGDITSYTLATRGASGWTDTPLGPPYTLSEANFGPTEAVAFDEPLTTSVWRASVPLIADSPPQGKFAFYRRSPDGSLTLLADLGESEPTVIGSSPDAGRLIFTDSGHLLPADVARTSGSGIYELDGQTLRELDVNALGEELSPCGATTGGSHPASESADCVVFTASPVCGEPARVFVAEGGVVSEASASHCTRVDCNAPQAVNVVGTTPDDGAIFMTTTQQLTNEDEDEALDLYRYDVADRTLTLVTKEIAGATGTVVEHQVQSGGDGAGVFFYARGRLVPGVGSIGGTNLYYWQEGELRFIAAQGVEQPLQASKSGRYGLLVSNAELSGVENERPLLFTFDGSDTTAGQFQSPSRIGFDEASGSLYVLDRGADVIDKFNAEGVAVPFSSTGTSSLNGEATPEGSLGLNGQGDISIDNSGTASQGRIYVNYEFGPIDAFAPDGTFLWQLPAELFHDDCGTAVDAEGHLWVSNWEDSNAFEFANTGSPPAQIGKVDSSTGQPCRLNLDRAGHLYFNIWNSKVDEYVGGSYATTLDSEDSQDVAIQQGQENGHLFTVHPEGFSEFTVDKGWLGSSGAGLIKSGEGIAYEPKRDWVYVADSGSDEIEVFGPPVSRPATNVPVEGSDEDGSADIYRYDTATNRLKLISTSPTAGNGRSSATFYTNLEEAGFVGPVVHFKAMNETGERIWFTTTERLVPEDHNDATDLYEWDAGQVYLLSGSSTTSQGVQFAGASADAGSVFFRTGRSIVPADQDGGDFDIYAAKVGGGFDESTPTPECAHAPCHRAPLAAPPSKSPATGHLRSKARGRLRIMRVPKRLQAAIVRTGRTRLLLHVPRPGLISARAQAGTVPLASGRAGATKAGKMAIDLVWPAKARRLVAVKKLDVWLHVSEGKETAKARLPLGRGGGR